MEDFEELEEMQQEESIEPQLMKEIEAKVEELRKANPKVKKIYPIVVDGDETDDKKCYVAYFSQPTLAHFSKYMTFAQKDNVVAMKQLAKDCFLGGDRELIDDDSLFLFGLMGQLGEIIRMRHGRLANLSKPGK